MSLIGKDGKKKDFPYFMKYTKELYYPNISDTG